jgi:hypothetical protein
MREHGNILKEHHGRGTFDGVHNPEYFVNGILLKGTRFFTIDNDLLQLLQ